MKRFLLSLVVIISCTMIAQAHMVYLVPAKDGQSIQVVFSDSLEPDQKVKMDKLAGLKLQARIGDRTMPVEFTKGDHSFTVKVEKGTSMVYGKAIYGLLTKAEKPTLLVYHPKAILAGSGDQSTVIGDQAALEIVPVSEAGKTRFQLLASGKPVSGAEGTIVLPDGTKEKVTTDKAGFTAGFEQTGRYAAYFKSTESRSGEHDGKKYDEVRHYATLVVDLRK